MRYSFIKVFVILLCLGFAISVGVCWADDWAPPAPTGNDGFDWIELTSGEWLKGRIKSMQQDELEFDSEKLDIRIWDWKDIRTVRSPRFLSVGFNDKSNLEGSVLVTPEEVTVVSQDGTKTFPRKELLAITPAGRRRLDKWSIDISIGTNSRQGNTSEVNNNSHITLRRMTPRNRQEIDYLGNYGKLDGKVSKDDQRLNAYSDFFFSDRFFLRAPDFEYFRDSQQNLAYRQTLGAGVGYDLIKTPRTEWQVTAGPAFQRNRYDSVEVGTSNSVNSGALVLGSLFDIELTKRIDYMLEYRGQFTRSAGGSNMHHTVSTLEFEIHKRLTLDLSFIWDRIAEPEPEENGATPEPDDFQFITSLGIHF